MKHSDIIAAALFALLGVSQGHAGMLQDVPTHGTPTLQDREAQSRTLGELQFVPNFVLLDEEEGRKRLSKIALDLPPGDWPLSARTLSKAGNVIVAAKSPAHRLTIDFERDGAGEKRVIVRAFDQAGQPVRLEDHQWAMFDLESKAPLPFQPAPSDQSVSVNVLLDRSGSIAGNMDTLLTSTRRFLESLPGQVVCKVSSFAGDVQTYTPGYVGCKTAAVTVPNIQARGGTALYPALLNAYRDMASLKTAGSILIVITDGIDSTGLSRAAVAAEKTVPTFVFWIGGWDKASMEGLAEYQAILTTPTPSQSQLVQWMNTVLGQVSETLRMQHTFVIETPAQAEGG